MPDLRSYAASLEREIVPPDFDHLERVASRRARVRVAGGLAAAGLAVAAALTLVPGASDDATLPAVSPTRPVTGAGLVAALTPDKVTTVHARATEMDPGKDDGHGSLVRQASACWRVPEGTVADADLDGDDGEVCREAFEFTHGGKRLVTPVTSRIRRMEAQYLGRGVFVHAAWGVTDIPSYVVDTDTMTMTMLSEGTLAEPPHRGRHLVNCGGLLRSACVVDLDVRSIALVTRQSLPAWITQLSAAPWFSSGQERIAPIMEGGQTLYFLPEGLPPREPSPLLVSTAMREAALLDWGEPLEPAAGLTWFPCTTSHCAVDVAGGTVHQVRLPQASQWAHNTIGGFWGVRLAGPTSGPEASGDTIRATAVWLDAKGEVATHDITGFHLDLDVAVADGGSTDAMTFYERTPNGPARLHVSTDRGRTWRILTVPADAAEDVDNGLLAPGWEAWPAAE